MNHRLVMREKGGWLSTQLERFRIAVLSWQMRTKAPVLVAKKQTQEPFTDWHSRFHFPKMQLRLSRVVPPLWSRVREFIASIPSLVSSCTDVPHLQRWRRACIGRPTSQQRICARDSALPVQVLSVSRRRVSSKTSLPPWMLEAQHGMSWRSAIMNRSGQGSEVREVLELYGVGCRNDIIHVIQLHRHIVKRVAMLCAHNSGAWRLRTHVSDDAMVGVRVRCAMCRSTGYHNGHLSWLALPCANGAKINSTVCIQLNEQLEMQADAAKRVLLALAALLKHV